jgi:enoyl-CoA hydratase/carnithine racemase
MTRQAGGAVRLKHEADVLHVTLNRPHKRNAINLELIRGFEEAIKHARHVVHPKVVVLRGEGGTFSSGADHRRARSPRR